MKIEVRRTDPEDIPHIAQYLRHDDRQEIYASTQGRIGPEMALLSSVFQSEQSLVITADGVAEAVGGVGGDGRVWLTGTDVMTAPPFRRWLLKNSRKWIDHLNDLYPVLHNRVDARNKAHVRWLKWCGFIFINRHFENDVEFLSFVRIPTPCA